MSPILQALGIEYDDVEAIGGHYGHEDCEAREMMEGKMLRFGWDGLFCLHVGMKMRRLRFAGGKSCEGLRRLAAAAAFKNGCHGVDFVLPAEEDVMGELLAVGNLRPPGL